MNNKNKEILNNLLRDVAIFDIETSSFDPLTGKSINIRTNFDKYVEYAECKWIGIYSFKFDKYVAYNCLTERNEVIEMLGRHSTFIGFNNERFDMPILKNNGLIKNKYIKQLDIQVILGNNKLWGHKSRAEYMGVDLKPVIINGKRFGATTLMSMAYHFKLDILKGDINYEIFHKDEWNDKETEEIKKYLKSDVIITKKLFEKSVIFWSIFLDWINETDIKKWVWLRSTIASLTYSAACKVKNVEPTFSNTKEESEEMGGRAVVPTQEETVGADYLDEASKYPHIFSEFNLFSEVNINTITPEVLQKELECGNIWHGNEMFKVKGYYEVSSQGVLEKDMINKLKTRWIIKKVLKDYKKTKQRNIVVPELLKEIISNNTLTDDVISTLDGLQYAIKIFANCFSPDTYVMTPNGIKNIKDFKIGDKCWSMNKKTLEVEEATVIEVQNYNHNGEFIHCNNKNTDLMVTEEHNMLNNNCEFIKANEFMKKRQDIPMHKPFKKQNISKKIFLLDFVNYDDYIYSLWKNGKDLRLLKKELSNFNITFIKRHGSHCDIITDKNTLKLLCEKGYIIKAHHKRSGNCTKNNIYVDTKDLSKFLGWFIADGNYYKSKYKEYISMIRGITYVLKIEKHGKSLLKEDIINTLNNLGLQNVRVNNNGVNFSSDMYYDIFKHTGRSINKHIPDFLWDIIDRQLCYDSMYACDGTKSRNQYNTISKELVKQLQIIIFERGYYFKLRKDSGVYRIINKKIKCKTLESNRMNRIKTDFKTSHCITLDKNNTIYAGRNNTFIWTGQSLYGAVRSSIFEQIHTSNAGWDCCWIGQQIHEYVEKFFISRGFKIVGGFTDSWFFERKEGYNKEKMKELAAQCMDEIKKYIPFPAETHIIDYECFIDYIVYNYDEKKKQFKKNNYAFISEGKIKIVGFPIKKNNASKLGLLIFNKYLRPEGLKKNRLKFEENYIKDLINKELGEDITLAAINYKCNPVNTYKLQNQLQAQISRAYLDSLDGSIELIKNDKYGKVGQTNKYCTKKEAKENYVRIDNIDLKKVWNELRPFIIKKKELTLDDWGL